MSPATTQPTARFPSLAALRAAHSDLLKQSREAATAGDLAPQIDQLIRQGRATGALLDSEDDRWAAQSLLDYWTSILYRNGSEPPDATLENFDSHLAPELADAASPYLGLEPFREDTKDLFYGRQKLVAQLLGQLRQHRLVAVVGSSGSGKSSVVTGGLVPALKQGALTGSETWHYYPPLVPGSHPLENLTRLLGSEPGGRSPAIPSQSVVLVIDQFEELFTLCHDPAERQAFIDHLLNLVQSPANYHLILTLRTDFESQVARFTRFKALFDQGQVRVTALDASELRDAIEKPAALVGLKFEEGLVDALLNDVLGEPAALPLLQFTLRKLWDERDRNRVTWEAYKRLGGGRRALANSADAFYESLIPEEQVTAKRILLSLVRPGEGLEVTSNRILKRNLYQSGEAGDRIDRVLGKLIAAHLVRPTQGSTSDDLQIEVAHEALIRNWPRLMDWLGDERRRLRQRLRLTTDAERWQARGKRPELLLRGILLEEALQQEHLSPLEQEFVRRSQQERTRRSQLRTTTTLVVIALLSGLSLFAFYQAETARSQQQEAERQAQRATDRQKEAETQAQLAAQRQREAETQKQLAEEQNRQLQLAIESLKNQREQPNWTQLQQTQRELSQVQQQINSGDLLQANKALSQFDVARAHEEKGFQQLLEGDLPAAQLSFQQAFKASSSYHNVNEINRLLQAQLEIYTKSEARERPRILLEVYRQIVENYAWGAPPTVIKTMRDRLY